MKTLAWISILTLLIIGGVVFYQSSSNSETDTNSTNINQDSSISDGDQELIIEFAEIDLVAKEGFEGASGTATRRYSGSKFEHAITATLPDSAEGKFYEGWLVNKDDNFFSTGPLTKIGDLWELNFESQLNYPNHTKVVVTEETQANGYDDIPETHVLEGSF